MIKERFLDLISVRQTSNRVMEVFFENLPDDLRGQKIPGMPQRTLRMLAGHIHNARCMWIKMIGKPYAVKAPKSVDRHRVTRAALLKALKQSNRGIIELLNAGLKRGGDLKMNIPWSNIPPDVLHFAFYLAAHEAHHRGQIVLAARQLGRRLSPTITAGLWQWKTRDKEVRKGRAGGGN